MKPMPPEKPSSKEVVEEPKKPTRLDGSMTELLRTTISPKEAEMFRNATTIVKEQWKPSPQASTLTLAQWAAAIHTMNPQVFERDCMRTFMPHMRACITDLEKKDLVAESQKNVRSYDGFFAQPWATQQHHLEHAKMQAHIMIANTLGSHLSWQTTKEGQKLFVDALIREDVKLIQELYDPTHFIESEIVSHTSSMERSELRERIETTRWIATLKTNPQYQRFFERLTQSKDEYIYTTDTAPKPMKWSMRRITIASPQPGKNPRAHSALLFQSLEHPLATFLYKHEVEQEESAQPSITLNTEIIGTKAAQTVKEEQSDDLPSSNKELQEYDLPTTKDIIHLRVFPSTFTDDLVWAKLVDSAALTTALSKRNPRVKRHPPIITNEPLADLRTAIKTAQAYRHTKNIHLCIDVFSHGTPDQLEFGPGKQFTQEDLLSLVSEFPDCTFTFNTMGCFGGGMRKLLANPAFINDPDVQQRLAVFLQTKPDIENVGTAGGMSLYYLYLIQSILKGSTYGKAAFDTDRKTKSKNGIDAEAIINGHLHSSIQPQPDWHSMLVA